MFGKFAGIFTSLYQGTQKRSGLLFSSFFLAIIYWEYFWKLGSLTPGLSAAEAVSASSSSSAINIWHNPLYLPHKLLQFVSQSILNGSVFSLRIVSVIFSILIFISFYLLIRKWVGRLIGISTTILLSATPWMIALGRSASVEICLLLMIIFCAYYSWTFAQKKPNNLAFFVLSAFAAILLYIPGVIWFAIVGYLFSRRGFISNIKKFQKTQIAISAAIIITALTPLIYALSQNHTLIKQLFLIPSELPNVISFAKDLGWNVLTLFAFSESHHIWLVGRLGILSAVESILLLFGIYAIFQTAKHKLFTLMGIAFLPVVFATLNNTLSLMSLSVPVLVAFSGVGLRFLYIEWRNVFPRNPLPKYFAYSLITLLSTVQIIYGIRYALYAWPNQPLTKTSYVIKYSPSKEK